MEGKGYEKAEKTPDKFHAVSPGYDVNVNALPQDYSAVFGNKLVELAKKDEKIVAITAAMKDGTGLTEFAKQFPDRFFDIGIAEEHGVRTSCRNGKGRLKASFCSIFFFYTKRI